MIYKNLLNEKKKLSLSLALLLILTISMVTANNSLINSKSSNNSIPKTAADDWTFMVYLDGDNNLEPDAIGDFLEMSSIGSDTNVDILVQFDRISGYDSSYDDWTETKRYHITNGMTPTSANAVMDLGEVNMGLSTSLSDFITWGVVNYPATNYAVILWDHGSGWKNNKKASDLTKSVCYDDTDMDYLTQIELQSALGNSPTIDLIGFDACLMAMAEVIYQVRNYADVFVGSEETEPLEGWPYDLILADLTASPTMTPSDLGNTIVTGYMQFYGSSSGVTQSAIDLSEINSLASIIDIFSSSLISGLGTYSSQIITSRTSTQNYYVPDYIDLYDFAENIYNNVPDSIIQTAANDVMSAVSSATISNGYGSYSPGSHGLSIYFPRISGNYDSDYESILDFTTDHLWDEFLNQYYSVGFPDDNYEENDDSTTAYNLIPYEGIWLSTIDGYGIQADYDYYEIYGTAGDTLTIDCVFSDSEGDIDIRLIDSALSVVASSTSVSDNEYIEYDVLTTGTYYIVVYYANTGNTYDLMWSTSGITPPPGDDNYEENDDPSTAYDLTPYEGIWLSQINGPGIQADDDYYEIYTTAGDVLTIECLFSHVEGDIDIALFDSALSVVAISGSISDDEHIEYNITTTGTYYIYVFLANAGNAYDLIWDTSGSIPPPIDDNYEDNDDYTTAYDLTPYEGIWLSQINGPGIQADDDWYEIYGTAGDTVTIDCIFSQNEGDINLYIADSTGFGIIGSLSTTDNEYIDYVLPSSGTYYILVYWGDAGNSYDLLWSTSGITPPPGDDNYEENDDPSTAYDLTPYEGIWLSQINGPGIQADEDWYEIYATAGTTLNIDCLFSHGEGNIDVLLIDSNINLLTYSVSETDNEYIEYYITITGTYYILVASPYAGNSYDLIWDASGITPPPGDDNYEENDGYTTAYDLTPYEDIWLSTIDGYGIQADDDWYEIYATAGATLNIDCLFSHGEGDIDVVLFDNAITVLAISESLSDNEYIEYDITTTGTYYILVGNANAGNSYDLTWSTSGITPPPGDDNYEENDDPSTAYDLTPYAGIWLSQINGPGIQADDDYYEIYGTAGDTLTIDCVFSHSEGDIDVFLIDSALSVVVISGSVSDNEYISYDVPTTGTYYIYVFYANAGNLYDLMWSSSGITPPPDDDNYEENDDPSTAYDLTPYEGIWLSQIDGLGIQLDVDVYEIYVTAGETLTIDCIFSHDEGNIDIVLIDSALNLVDYSFSETDNEYISYDILTSGTYYIAVGNANAGNSYDLIWDASGITPPPGDDNYEENDDMASAYDLPYNGTWLSTIDGYGIQADDDWYAIFARAGDTITIDCVFSHSEGNIDVFLIDSTGSVLTGSTSVTDNEHIEYDILTTTGIFYILVTYANAGNSYDLLWDLSPFDTTPPTWDPTPTDQTIEFGSDLSYDVDATDYYGIASYWINDTDNFNIDGNGLITNVIPLAIGDYWIRIVSYDLYDNYCDAVIRITVIDTTAPTWDQTPSDQTIEYGVGLSYDVDASDLSGIYAYTINNTNFDINLNGLITNVVALAVGEYWIEIRAYDPYGLYCSAVIKINVVDTTSPSWLETPTDQTIEVGDDFSYDVDASDLSGIANYWIDDTANFNIDASGLITNNVELEEGVYDLLIRAYDLYGNYCEATITIIVTPPEGPDIPGYEISILFVLIGISTISILAYIRKKYSVKNV